MRLVEEMRRHCTCGGLAMRAGNAESFAAAGNRAQYLGTFMYLETILPEIDQFGMFLRNGRGVHHQCAFLVLANLRDETGVFLIMYLCTFCNEMPGQFTRRTVISRHELAFG